MLRNLGTVKYDLRNMRSSMPHRIDAKQESYTCTDVDGHVLRYKLA